MKRGECAKSAHLMAGRLLRLLGLGGWTLDLVVGPCSDDTAMAEIAVLSEYRTANAVVDPRRIRDHEHLVEVLAHETLHILLHEVEGFSDIMDAALAEDLAMRRVLSTALTQAIERSVCGLESLVVKAYRAEFGE